MYKHTYSYDLNFINLHPIENVGKRFFDGLIILSYHVILVTLKQCLNVSLKGTKCLTRERKKNRQKLSLSRGGIVGGR